ncbi:MAG: hypothetical protein ACOVMP_00470 [Chthoniobacterales bacterium]
MPTTIKTPSTEPQTPYDESAPFCGSGRTQWPTLPARKKLRQYCPRELEPQAAVILAKLDAAAKYLAENNIAEMENALRIASHGVDRLTIQRRIDSVDLQAYSAAQAAEQEGLQACRELGIQLLDHIHPFLVEELREAVFASEQRLISLEVPLSREEYRDSNHVTVFELWQDSGLTMLHQKTHALAYLARCGRERRIYADDVFRGVVRYLGTDQPAADPLG